MSFLFPYFEMNFFFSKCAVNTMSVFQNQFCPALRAGFLNPLTRKIVFVRPACVRACVRACVCTLFPYCDFATFHFLLEKRRFLKYNFAAHFLFEKRRLWTKIRDFAAHFLFEKRRFWTKIRDVGRKYANLRLTSFLKSDYFGRKYAMLDENT